MPVFNQRIDVAAPWITEVVSYRPQLPLTFVSLRGDATKQKRSRCICEWLTNGTR